MTGPGVHRLSSWFPYCHCSFIYIMLALYILYVTEREKIASTVTSILQNQGIHHIPLLVSGNGGRVMVLIVPLAGVQNSQGQDATQKTYSNYRRCFILSLDVQCFHFRGFLGSRCSNVSAHHTGDRLGFR